MIEGEEQELILNTLAEQPQEEIRTLEEDIYVIGVESLNGQAGDLTLKNINGEDLVGEGNIALQTPLTETQMDAVDSGIDSTKVAQIATNAGDITTLQNTKQDNLTQTQLNAVNSGIDQTKVAQIATNTGNITSNTNRISTIEGKIPSAASSSNQLTDKNYVDNSIATNTANYISDNGQPFQSYADLVAYSGTLTNNDYAFVVSTDAAGNLLYTRYKYNASQNLWAEEYTIANPTFTSDQWASINSGVTANDVSQIGTNKTDISTLTTSKQDALSQTQLDAVNSGINATKVQQIADNTTAIATKQDKLVAGTNIQIAADGKTISATDTKYTAGTGLTLTGTQFSVTEPVPAGFFTDTASTQEGEGTRITLNNTTDAPIDGVELKGNTTQDTLTGKNKLGYDYASIKSVNSGSGRVFDDNAKTMTYNGITYKINDDGTILVTGTSSGNSFLVLVNPVSGLVPGTNYILNGCPSGGSASTYSLRIYTSGSYEWDGGSGLSFAYGSQDILRINMSGGTAAPTDGLLFKPMIRLATETDPTFEEYCGGSPSPNPDYPSPVNLVTGGQQVQIYTTNKFKTSGVVNLACGNTILASDSYRGWYYPVTAGETYLISRASASAPGRFRISFTSEKPVGGAACYNEAGARGNDNHDIDTRFKVTVPAGMTYLFIDLSNSNETITDDMGIEVKIAQNFDINLGKNLFNKNASVLSATHCTYTFSDGVYTITNTDSSNPQISLALTLPAGSYILNSSTALSRSTIIKSGSTTTANLGTSYQNKTFTTTESSDRVQFNWLTTSDPIILDLNTLQIELGSQATSYSAYFTPIELCKIGNYQDYIWKDGADWKIHKATGHKQLDAAITGIRQDGNAHADYVSYTGAFAITAGAWNNAGGDYNNDIINARQSKNCGQFRQQNITANGGANSMIDGTFCQRSGTNDRIYMRFSSLAGKTGAELKAILSAQGGSDFYYYLATATDTVITDAGLIAQLEALASSTTYAPQTNYATAGTGTNLPVILTVEVFKNNYAGLLARLEKAGA